MLFRSGALALASVGFEIPDYIEAEKNGDYGKAIHIGINAEVALIGALTGPIGWGISGAYLLIDGTIGWGNAYNSASNLFQQAPWHFGPAYTDP